MALGLNPPQFGKEGFGKMFDRNSTTTQSGSIESRRFPYDYRRSSGDQSFFGRLLSTIYAWQSRSSSRHHLSGLDDAALKDMGLSRSDAYRESTKAFWRE
jgi:uncharacterized protein YjiS (DUF1127 family)